MVRTGICRTLLTLVDSASGLPTSSRYTFTPALQASVHCVSARFAIPGFARFHSPLEDVGSPSRSHQQQLAVRSYNRLESSCRPHDG
jgi:hypothetical protein